MLNQMPPITPKSPSVKEELQNVEVGECWMHAVAHEADNDFHVILGSASNTQAGSFMNSELCGIDNKSPSAKQLKQVRETFVTELGLNTIGHAYHGYVKFHPPLH